MSLRSAILLGVTICLSIFPNRSESQDRLTPSVDLQFRWEFDPDLGTRWVPAREIRPKEINLSAIQSQNLQSQIDALQDAIAYAVSPNGVSNRLEAFPVVRELLNDPGIRDVRRAFLHAASAAAVLASNRSEIESLWPLVEAEPVVRRPVERRLAQFGSQAALGLWRQRLEDLQPALQDLLVAIEGLGSVGESSDIEALKSMLTSPSTLPPIQLAVAKALGALSESDLEGLARQLFRSGTPQQHVLAAYVLKSHTSAESKNVLLEIMEGTDTQAQRVAFEILAGRDPVLARQLALELVEHPEHNLRAKAFAVLNDADDARSLNTLAKGLADDSLTIRNTVRRHLGRKAKIEKNVPAIDSVISEFLSSERWQAIEQAIWLAVDLKEHRRAAQFVRLLEHPRPEVQVRAAWGLQQLDLQPPQLAEILQVSLGTTEKLTAGKRLREGEERRTAFLFEALGRHKFDAASDMLKLYIPRDNQRMRELTRIAAIYALGYIWEGSQESELARDLGARVKDNGTDPELETVRYASAIALGRIGGPTAIRDLQVGQEDPPAPLGFACGWALNQLTPTAP